MRYLIKLRGCGVIGDKRRLSFESCYLMYKKLYSVWFGYNVLVCVFS